MPNTTLSPLLIDSIIQQFRQLAPPVDFWSLRLVQKQFETLRVRQGVVQLPDTELHVGAHITLVDGNGVGYAATPYLHPDGLREAIDQAMGWVQTTATAPVLPPDAVPRPERGGQYRTPTEQPWDDTPIEEKISWLQQVNSELNIDAALVDRQAMLRNETVLTYLITSDGVIIDQQIERLMPGFMAVANRGNETQRRTGGGWGSARQGGLELLQGFQFPDDAQRCAEQALQLLDAPECPSAEMSVLLMPNQMALQIHESIGHPLEMDRILSDERNFAGSSFVKPEMCGSYRYGSELLNVVFDPSLEQAVATYAFDDEGTPAEKAYLIRDGILQRLLGSATSQARLEQPGVACGRAGDWNRPAIDRMANINIEPGDKDMNALLESVENGILLDTNASWSIDDKRNKFQFGCEVGYLIRDGQLQGMVKNPNYRGISATFWRDLVAVGDASTRETWSASFCGKGEPQQQVQAGHSAPACVFDHVDVFGGD